MCSPVEAEHKLPLIQIHHRMVSPEYPLNRFGIQAIRQQKYLVRGRSLIAQIGRLTVPNG